MLHFFLQNRTTIGDGRKYMFIGKKLIVPLNVLCSCCCLSFTFTSNFLKPILILCPGDLFLYGTETMIYQIKRQGWMVVVWDGQEGPGASSFRTFFLFNFFPVGPFPLF